MAVTNLKFKNVTTLSGPSGVKVTSSFGNGTPVADAVMENDTQFPIGCDYTDLSTSKIYTKTAAATWTDSSAA